MENLVAAIHDWVSRHYPHNPAATLWIELQHLGKVKLPIPIGPVGPVRSGEPKVFRPNAHQRKILDALDGKALGGKALADLLFRGDKKFLQRPNVMKALRDLGLVEVDPNVGYYRPDSPPDGIELEETED